MAQDAKILDGFSIDKVFIFGPMRTVTTTALQGQVLVPGVNDFFPDGMSGMRLPFMALSTHIQDGGFIHEEEFVGAVGGMAGCAFAFGNGRMFCPRSFLPGHGVRVA